jgi:hypothetical protein
MPWSRRACALLGEPSSSGSLSCCLLDLTCAGIIGCRTSRAVAVAKLGRLIAMMPASRKPLWWPLTTSSSALIMSDSSRT